MDRSHSRVTVRDILGSQVAAVGGGWCGGSTGLQRVGRAVSQSGSGR